MSGMSSEETKPNRDFIPAKPSPWLMKLAQALVKMELAIYDKVHLPPQDLAILNNLPAGNGMILTPNHADEMDPPVCLELSRLAKLRFIFMGNREAFDEFLGLAGWVLQRIGLFSVERGGHDTPAKQFATDVVKGSRDVLVIFPEGEIYYLNESVQPFHSGAVDIGMRAIIEQRQTKPDWTAYIVPVAIVYRYAAPIKKVLEKRVRKMEARLSADMTGHELHKRLTGLMSEVLNREEAQYNIKKDDERLEQLSDRVTRARHAILEQVEVKYTTSFDNNARTIDRAFQLSAHVRELLAKSPGAEKESGYRTDLAALKQVAHMVSWQPQYIEDDNSDERSAEMVLKLEREIYHTKRPQQIARRNVYLRVGEPVDLASFLQQYKTDAHTVRRVVADQLRSAIQVLIDEEKIRLSSTS